MEEWTVIAETEIDNVPVRILRHECGSLRLLTRQFGTIATEGAIVDDNIILGRVINDGEELLFEADSVVELIDELKESGFPDRINLALENMLQSIR
jgi:hypothetical protein